MKCCTEFIQAFDSSFQTRGIKSQVVLKIFTINREAQIPDFFKKSGIFLFITHLGLLYSVFAYRPNLQLLPCKGLALPIFL